MCGQPRCASLLTLTHSEAIVQAPCWCGGRFCNVLMRYLQLRRLAPCTRSPSWPQQLMDSGVAGPWGDIPAPCLIAAQGKTRRHQKCQINYLLIDTSTWGQMKPEHPYCPGSLPLANRFRAKNTTAVLWLINFTAYPAEVMKLARAGSTSSEDPAVAACCSTQLQASQQPRVHGEARSSLPKHHHPMHQSHPTPPYRSTQHHPGPAAVVSPAGHSPGAAAEGSLGDYNN